MTRMSLLKALQVSALATALVALAAPRAARAQEPVLRGGAGVVRGVVQAGPDEPVPYAVVALQPRFTQRFTDAAGSFAFTHVPAGTYHLIARQVGFKPIDTTVVLVADQALSLTLTLERITVQLEEITVVASRGCTQPGPPDAGSPELVALFSELKQNAQQFKLLATTYQFRYWMARTFTDLDEVGNVVSRSTDTAIYLSSAQVHYRPGDVLSITTLPDGTTSPAFVLPTLTDLADSVFQANHCFSFSGRVEQDKAEVVRFHFRPPESMTSPDFEGDVDLDPRTFHIVRASVTLTHSETAQAGVRAAGATTTFSELLPNVVVQQRVMGYQDLAAPVLQLNGHRHISRYLEDQHLVATRFLHALPGGQQPSR